MSRVNISGSSPDEQKLNREVAKGAKDFSFPGIRPDDPEKSKLYEQPNIIKHDLPQSMGLLLIRSFSCRISEK